MCDMLIYLTLSIKHLICILTFEAVKTASDLDRRIGRIHRATDDPHRMIMIWET